MSLETHGDLFAAAGKASPMLGVSGAAAVGVPLQDWVLIATLVYTVLQIGLLIYNFTKRRARDRRQGASDAAGK